MVEKISEFEFFCQSLTVREKNKIVDLLFPVTNTLLFLCPVAKAVNREDKRSRRYRDRDFAKFERSRCYRDC